MIENRSLRSVTLLVVGWIFCRAILLNLPLPATMEQSRANIAAATSSVAIARHELRPAHASFDRHEQPVRALYKRHDVAGGKIQPANAENPSIPWTSSVVAVAALPGMRQGDQAWAAFESVKSDRPDVPLALPALVTADRWTVSMWLLQRAGAGGVTLATNGQLGGSQVGFRAQRALFHPVYGIETRLNVRVSGAVATLPGAEAAIGLSFKNRGRVPLELLVERRVGLNGGGRDDFAIVAVTGVNETPIAQIASATAYLQAGMVGFAKPEFFADGAMRIERRLAPSGPADISLGLGGWGAIQRGASRLDVGPIMSSRFRIGHASMRMSAEWRQRVAGSASPASGPAFTVGMDF